jgi:uncharacterized membrane protein
LSAEYASLFRATCSDAEGYTFSAVWLAFGVVLLVVGIVLRSQPVASPPPPA